MQYAVQYLLPYCDVEYRTYGHDGSLTYVWSLDGEQVSCSAMYRNHFLLSSMGNCLPDDDQTRLHLRLTSILKFGGHVGMRSSCTTHAMHLTLWIRWIINNVWLFRIWMQESIDALLALHHYKAFNIICY